MTLPKPQRADTDKKMATETALEEASTHKSASTNAGNVFVTRDLDLLTQK